MISDAYEIPGVIHDGLVSRRSRLRRRLTFPAAAIVLVLSFVLTGLWIWTADVI
jgi:hypothetical protein